MELPTIPAFLPVAAPGMIWAGAALTAGPVIIHLLNQRRYRILEWAAMEFLLEALKQTRKRMQVEELLLLLLRMTLLALLGLAMAKPLLSALAGPDAPDSDADAAARRADHVIILDDSVSMGQAAAEGALFDKVKTEAAGLLTKLGVPERRLDTVSVLRTSWFDAPASPKARKDPAPGTPATGATPAGTPDARTATPAPSTKTAPKIDPRTGKPEEKPAEEPDLPDYVADVELRPLETKEVAAEVTAQIKGLSISDAVGRLELAVRAAREIATRGAHPNKRIYLITDCRARDFDPQGGGTAERLKAAAKALDPKTTRLLVQDVGSGPGRNVGIVKFQPTAPTLIAGVKARLQVVVRNHHKLAGVPRSAVTVRLLDAAGNVLPGTERPLTNDLAAAGSRETRDGRAVRTDETVENFDLPLATAGWSKLTAELVFPGGAKAGAAGGGADTLDADNRAFLAVEVRPNVPVLLVHDPPPPDAGPRRASFFLYNVIDFRRRDREILEAAAKAGKGLPERLNGARAEERSITGLADERGRIGFSNYDIVMFADVAKPEDPGAGRDSAKRLVEELERYVRAGGNVVFHLGGSVNAEFWNTHLFKDGDGLAPCKLDRQFKEPAGFRRMVATDANHPFFGRFKDGALSQLLAATVKVQTWWAVDRNRTPSGATAPLVLDDPAASPIWMEKRFGDGRVMVFLSSPDKTWNDWVDSYAYPIVMTDLVASMTRGRRSAEARTTVGTGFEVALPEEADPAAAGQLTLAGPPEEPDPLNGSKRREQARIDTPKPLLERDAEGRILRAAVKVNFPHRDIGGKPHPARAGFYSLNWAALVPEDIKAKATAAGRAPVVESVVERNIDPLEGELDRADRPGDLFADLKDAEGKALVLHNPAFDTASGKPSPADPALFEPPATKKKDQNEEDLQDKDLFYKLMVALLLLMLVEQFLAMKFSRHET